MLAPLITLDAALQEYVIDLPHPGWLNTLFSIMSVAAIGGALWLALGLALARARVIRPTDLLRLVVAIGLVHGIVDVVLKPWVDRPRPTISGADGWKGSIHERPTSRSFPSGHAANAVAAAAVLSRTGSAACRVVWIPAILVLVARVYLGMNYPLDALAGGLIGLLCAWAVLLPQIKARRR
jgi:undecaprenyl-diphosphatase